MRLYININKRRLTYFNKKYIKLEESKKLATKEKILNLLHNPRKRRQIFYQVHKWLYYFEYLKSPYIDRKPQSEEFFSYHFILYLYLFLWYHYKVSYSLYWLAGIYGGSIFHGSLYKFIDHETAPDFFYVLWVDDWMCDICIFCLTYYYPLMGLLYLFIFNYFLLILKAFEPESTKDLKISFEVLNKDQKKRYIRRRIVLYVSFFFLLS